MTVLSFFTTGLKRIATKFLAAQTKRTYGTKRIQTDRLLNLQMGVPPLPVQRRVARILSAYDDLIENNLRRIRILQEMARSLYREWFVNFRFPGHENTKRVSSPLGAIPQGWGVKVVKDILSRRAAGTVYRGTEVKREGSTPVVDQSTNELLGFHDNEPDHFASPGKPMAIFGDHTCKMQLLVEPFSVGPNVVPFAAVDEFPTAYVFYVVHGLVSTQEYKRHWIPLNAMEVVVADSATAQSFASAIQPMHVAQEVLRKMMHNLRQTRDLLLPRLLSGTIDFSDADSSDSLSSDAGKSVEPVAKTQRHSNTVATSTKESPLSEAATQEHSGNQSELGYELPPSIDQSERSDVLAVIRQVFSDGHPRNRQDAIRQVARTLGYGRVGHRINDVLRTDLLTAVRRGILDNVEDELILLARSIAGYDRDFLKQQFLAAIGRSWIERDDAIQNFCRWMGFRRTGQIIDETARSVIQGLLRESRLEADGPTLIRRSS